MSKHIRTIDMVLRIVETIGLLVMVFVLLLSSLEWDQKVIAVGLLTAAAGRSILGKGGGTGPMAGAILLFMG